MLWISNAVLLSPDPPPKISPEPSPVPPAKTPEKASQKLPIETIKKLALVLSNSRKVAETAVQLASISSG